jgi:hypothetical protein
MTSDWWSGWSEPERRYRVRCQVFIHQAHEGPGQIGEYLRGPLPPRDAVWWVTFLPGADVDVFLTELVTVAQGAAELGNPAPPAVFLTQWWHSAEVYADPALLEILTTAPEGDFGSVPAPSRQE